MRKQLSDWHVRANEQLENWVIVGCKPEDCLTLLGFRDMPANWAAVWNAIVIRDAGG